MNPDLAPLFNRRSVRHYLDRSVSDAQIQDILEAGMSAPSARAQDPWEILVIRQAETLQRLADGLPNGPMLAKAPLGFIVCGDLQRSHDRNLSFLLQDVSACTENMLLALSMMGLGGCWICIHPREERIAHVRNLFRLPPNIVPVCAISTGYSAESLPSRTRFDPSRVHSENW